MELKKKSSLPWYVQSTLLLFPMISVTANLTVGIILFTNSVNQQQQAQPKPQQQQSSPLSMFTTKLFVSSLFALFVLLTRHVEISRFYLHADWLNKMSLYFGVMFIFGKMMIEASTTPTHFSILLYLLGAALYGSSQVFIFYRNFRKQRKLVQCLRGVFCVSMLVNVMLFGAFIKNNNVQQQQQQQQQQQLVRWRLECCVAANIVFQHLWSFIMEKFHNEISE